MSPLGRYSCITQGGMRAKPDMKPWVHTKRKVIWAPSGAALSAHTFGLCCGRRSAAPKGAQKKWVSMPNPGLAPWALKKYRPIRGSSTTPPRQQVRHTHENKYDVLTSVSTRKHFGKYAHSLSWVRRTYFRSLLKVDCVRINSRISKGSAHIKQLKYK